MAQIIIKMDVLVTNSAWKVGYKLTFCTVVIISKYLCNLKSPWVEAPSNRIKRQVLVMCVSV